MDAAVVAAILTALFGGGGIGAVFAWRKTSAEAEALSAATLRGIIEELRTELERIQKERVVERESWRKENAMLRERLAILESKANV